ncbi:hypothetical protein [Halolamina salifodinae]|uniref:Uncharacterized protein n=1 Tax=Halolamina salifodinae TaxID=1202767 RepID=A0A8T4GTS4_9EURY|nr:hypothetical protein [Halolamina salifodinae]MBP1985552.1 hypothetical protein [Halolamina salifodinae]
MEIDHPSWRALAGALGGYGLILLAMTVLLFAVPTAIFTLL